MANQGFADRQGRCGGGCSLGDLEGAQEARWPGRVPVAPLEPPVLRGQWEKMLQVGGAAMGAPNARRGAWAQSEGHGGLEGLYARQEQDQICALKNSQFKKLKPLITHSLA